MLPSPSNEEETHSSGTFSSGTFSSGTFSSGSLMEKSVEQEQLTPEERTKRCKQFLLELLERTKTSDKVKKLFRDDMFISPEMPKFDQRAFTSSAEPPILRDFIRSLIFNGNKIISNVLTYINIFIDHEGFLLLICWLFVHIEKKRVACEKTLREWIKLRPFDFPKKLFKEIMNFFQRFQNMKESPQANFYASLEHMYESFHTFSLSKPITVVANASFISPSSIDPSKWRLIDVIPEEFSRQLTIIFYENYLYFLRNDLPAFIFDNCQQLESLKFFKLHRNLSLVVVDLTFTLKQCEFWVDVANYCMSCQNISCAITITESIQLISTFRDFKPRNLSSELKQKVDDFLQNYVNFYFWEAFFQKNRGPIIPYFRSLCLIAAKDVKKNSWYEKLPEIKNYLKLFDDRVAQQSYHFTSHQRIHDMIMGNLSMKH